MPEPPKSLFDHHREEQLQREAPLAARMRPRTLDEFVGQEHLVGEGRMLRQRIETDQGPWMVLWGAPGVTLPYVEDGVVTLIGATTENPSFEVISPLLSRCRVYSMNPLSPEQIEVILRRAMTDPEHGLAHLNPEVDYEALTGLAQASGGDARIALNALELAAATVPPAENGVRHIALRDFAEALQPRTTPHHKAG